MPVLSGQSLFGNSLKVTHSSTALHVSCCSCAASTCQNCVLLALGLPCGWQSVEEIQHCIENVCAHLLSSFQIVKEPV